MTDPACHSVLSGYEGYAPRAFDCRRCRWDYVLRDNQILGHYFEHLKHFYAYTRQHDIHFIVVMFPILNDLEHCRRMTSKVKELFQQMLTPVVDVADLVQEMAVSERTANRHDAHPSARVHELVADAIGKLLKSR